MSNLVTIIGGGAAGLTAAIAAARAGAAVVIVERNARVGRKILVTGNGRCNMTNVNLDLNHYHGNNPAFAESALTQFGFDSTIAFFRELGVEPRIEDNGRVYPMSLQAGSVLDVLRYEVERLGVGVMLNSRVAGIIPQKKGFLLELSNGQQLYSDRVLVATGGRAVPQLGATGDGYQLASQLGHRIVEPFPALVQLRTCSPYLKRLNGIKIEGAVTVHIDGSAAVTAQGDILFADYGLSGSAVFEISRAAARGLRSGKSVAVGIDLLPQYSQDELHQLLELRFRQQKHKEAAFSFVGFIHKQLAPVVLLLADVETKKLAGEITYVEQQRIAAVLKDWRMPVTGTQPWSNAQLTCGGVDVSQVNPDTMESRLVPGLYFAGEVLDIDGDCGGYNLQWAWSSGYVAGKAIATA